MAEDPYASLDLDSLVKTATSVPPSTSYVGDTIKKVEGIRKQEDAELGPIREQIKTDSAKGKADADAKTPKPADLQPWTAKPPEQNPIQAFGSFGSIFGILASAATHQPWQSSMNAATAAMNAVKANDAAAYKEAYQAWKDNTDLMLKTHDAQYKDFQAAMEKRKTDVAESNAMLTTLSAKYGDHITDAYKEAGLMGQLNEAWASRQKAALGILEVMPKIEEQNMTITAVHDLQAARKSGDPQAIAAATQNLHDLAAAKYPSMANQNTVAGQRATAIQQGLQEWRDAHNGQEPDAATRTGIIERVTRSESRAGTQSDFISQYKKEQRDAGSAKTDSELDLEARQKWSSNLTGNQRQKLEEHVDQFDNSLDRLDKVSNALDKYVGAAGVAGKALRAKEIVSNIFGSSDTDRVQFRRDIEYLQTMSHRLLTDASGRPLSSDAKKLDDVIGGLNMGDTTANTLRSLQEIKTLYNKMRGDTVSQLQGTWGPRGSGGASATSAAPSADKPWLSAPVVK